MYIDILRRLRDSVRRRRREKWRNNSCSLFNNNAPAHRSVLVKDFSAKNNITTLEHFPYPRDLASTDLYLFPGLKSWWRGGAFCGVSDIIKNATEELKRFSQHCFQGCVNNFTVAQWECFEGNVAGMVSPFCVSQKYSNFGNVWSCQVHAFILRIAIRTQVWTCIKVQAVITLVINEWYSKPIFQKLYLFHRAVLSFLQFLPSFIPPSFRLLTKTLVQMKII
jgi:hypothetical protein